MIPCLVHSNRKRCCQCRKIKSVDEFYKNKNNADGKDRRCRDCNLRAATSYFHDNREKVLRLSKERYSRLGELGREKKRKYWAGWRARNKDRYLEIQARYRMNHPERDRFKNLQRRFGISGDTYKKMHSDQGGVCAICLEPETRIFNGKMTNLAVDHCHTTKKVRGLLCSRCNRAIGFIKDVPERAFRMGDYLLKNQ